MATKDELPVVNLIRISVLYNGKKYGAQYNISKDEYQAVDSDAELDRLAYTIGSLTGELLKKIEDDRGTKEN